jgi:hypothetical protein
MSSFEEVYKNALHDDTVAECMWLIISKVR